MRAYIIIKFLLLTGKGNDKKFFKAIIYLPIAIILLHLACSCDTAIEDFDEQPVDYKPMIFVNDTLYGDCGVVSSELPSTAVLIGTIEEVVSQTEPMVHKEFCSNLLPVDSEIYYDVSTPEIIYTKPPSTDSDYILYVIIK